MYKLVVSVAKANIVWLMFLISSCAPASVTMDSTFQDLNVHVAPTDKCNIVVESLEDHRRNKESLGVVAYTEVFSQDPLLWVENGLKSFGIVKRPVDYMENDRHSVQLSLKLAHISSLLSAKTANTVLGFSQDNFETVKYFRGSHASINWSGSPGEIKKAFDLSLALAIKSMTEDMASNCNVHVE